MSQGRPYLMFRWEDAIVGLLGPYASTEQADAAMAALLGAEQAALVGLDTDSPDACISTWYESITVMDLDPAEIAVLNASL